MLTPANHIVSGESVDALKRHIRSHLKIYSLALHELDEIEANTPTTPTPPPARYDENVDPPIATTRPLAPIGPDLTDPKKQPPAEVVNTPIKHKTFMPPAKVSEEALVEAVAALAKKTKPRLSMKFKDFADWHERADFQGKHETKFKIHDNGNKTSAYKGDKHLGTFHHDKKHGEVYREETELDEGAAKDYTPHNHHETWKDHVKGTYKGAEFKQGVEPKGADWEGHTVTHAHWKDKVVASFAHHAPVKKDNKVVDGYGSVDHRSVHEEYVTELNKETVKSYLSKSKKEVKDVKAYAAASQGGPSKEGRLTSFLKKRTAGQARAKASLAK